jgi:hypothetical protein
MGEGFIPREAGKIIHVCNNVKDRNARKTLPTIIEHIK